jgi:Ni,Fe-hydrogenase III large subunit
VAPSIVDLCPAVGWDEREAHDRDGVRFAGHEPLRPLLAHPDDPAAWTVPVDGEDAYAVAVGPIHAGVIESGHFRFRVVGERILHVDARLFYGHRGLERAAEGHTPVAGLAYVERACAACSVANAVAYAQACEAALGLTADAALARARTILLELERTWSHLNDVAAVCAGTGFAAGNQRFAALTERARALNADVGGHRFLRGSVAVGAGAAALPADAARRLRAALRGLEADARSAWRELVFNGSFQDRLGGVGVLDAAAARELGATGPAARAAGLREDARTAAPGLAYAGLEAVVPARACGDVADRLEQRALELWQSLALLDDALDGAVQPGGVSAVGPSTGLGAARVESSRGATTCVVDLAAGRLRRVRLRTGSYANWPSVAHAAAGNLLPDFPLVNKSFELCYACVDR